MPAGLQAQVGATFLPWPFSAVTWGQAWAEVEQGEWTGLMLTVETGSMDPHPHPAFTSLYLLLLPLPGTLPHFPCQLQHGQKEVPSNTVPHHKAQPPQAL